MFANLATLRSPLCFFVEVKKWGVGDILGYYLLKHYFYIFTYFSLNICWKYFKLSKGVCLVMFLDLKLSFDVNILAFFGLATVSAIFRKIGRIFSNLLVTLVLNTQHYDIQHNDTRYNDTLRKDIQHNDTQYNDT